MNSEASQVHLPSNSIGIFVTSTMQRYGETGVQTHINDFLCYLEEAGLEGRFVGPEDAIDRRLGYRLVRAVLRRIKHLNGSLVTFILRNLFFHAMRSALKKEVGNHSTWTIYAQDPVSAQAALSIRRTKGQHVILAVHFNLSQAIEMADRGVILRDSWVFNDVFQKEQRVLAQVDGLVFFSLFMQNHIAQRGIVPRRSTLVPHSAPVPVPDSEVPVRDLIAIGSLEPRKNQEYLLRVLNAAKLQGYVYTLTLVGSGEDRERLELLASELGIGEQLAFLTKTVGASSLLASHRILVHAAKIENFPITLVEGLAAGKPILAPPVGGIPEVYRNEIEGYFWPLDDPAKGASILIRLMEDVSLRARMSAAASLRYRATFSRESVKRRLLFFVVGVE